MKENLLPNYFKTIGLITGLIFFTLLLLIHFFPGQNPFSINNLKIEWIIKDVILISLLLIAFSKEKNETDKIFKLRFHKLKESILFGGVLLFYDSLLVLGYDDNDRLKSGFEIFIIIIVFYIITVNLKKRVLKEKPGHNNI